MISPGFTRSLDCEIPGGLFNILFYLQIVAFFPLSRLIIKAKYMKNATQQEVLLMTGTSFTSGQLAKMDGVSGTKNFSDIELMAEACWNGLLPELLPEIFTEDITTKKSYLWQIREGNSFLELQWAPFPEKKDKFFSIDPYDFLSEENFN